MEVVRGSKGRLEEGRPETKELNRKEYAYYFAPLAVKFFRFPFLRVTPRPAQDL
jgi:hypothetical protein